MNFLLLQIRAAGLKREEKEKVSDILKYNQAKVGIFQLISEKNLQIGERIPPERELVERFDLSLITLRRAMHELEQEKIIRRVPRQGTFLNRPIRKVPVLGTILYIRIYKEEYGERFSADGLRPQVETVMKEHHFNVIYRNAMRPDLELAKMAASCTGIFVSGWLDDEWLAVLQSLGRPLVVIGDNPYSEKLPTVTFDFAEAAELLYDELLRRGCDTIGFINGGDTYVPAKWMYVGFQAAAKRAGRRVPPESVIWSSQTRIADDISGFLAKNPDLDGLLVECGELDALLAALWHTDYPRKLKIAAIVESRDMVRPLLLLPDAIVAQFEKNMVPAAADMMLSLLKSGRKPASLRLHAFVTTPKKAHENFIAEYRNSLSNPKYKNS